MFKISRRCALGAFICATAFSAPALAATWPDGPVKLIVPSTPGGSTDVMARLFADYLERATHNPVVVVNQPSGGGTVAFDQVRKARPDGQELLFVNNEIIIANETGSFDHTIDEYTPIATAQTFPPQVYMSSAKNGWHSLKDFVAAAKENPGKYTIGVSIGRSSHFLAGLLMKSAGIKLNVVQAGAESEKVAALSGGFISIGNMGIASAAQYQKSGSMQVLAVLSKNPDPAYPDFPTAPSEGYDVTWDTPMAIFGPKGMDPKVVSEISAAIRGMGEDEKVAQQLEKTGSRFEYRDPAETKALFDSEKTRLHDLADFLGLASKK